MLKMTIKPRFPKVEGQGIFPVQSRDAGNPDRADRNGIESEAIDLDKPDQGESGQGSNDTERDSSGTSQNQGNPPSNTSAPVWLARVAFALVFFVNIQCALSFILAPSEFAAAYELTGVAGEAAVRGLGIAFLMWNATYPPFIAAPRKFPVLGWVILTQQLIGLIGELALLLALPAGHAVLAGSITRFVVFDAVGLALMTAAFILLKK